MPSSDPGTAAAVVSAHIYADQANHTNPHAITQQRRVASKNISALFDKILEPIRRPAI
jgi:hypothetical protein